MDSIKRMTMEDILNLKTFVPYPMIVFNPDRVLLYNKLFEELDISKTYLMENVKVNLYNELSQSRLYIPSGNGTDKFFELSNQPVKIEEEVYCLTYLIDETDKQNKENKLLKMCEEKDRMIEIINTTLFMNDLKEVLKLILDSALKAFERASMGTVFIYENDNFRVASYVGFTKELEDFLLPLKDSYLYVATEGKLDRIVSTGNFQEFERRYPIETNFGEGNYIQSTISSPIYIKGAFMGMINIDSMLKNAFDEDDMKSMEFIRNNIEIAISNHLSYRHESLMAKYDSLTQIYNRYFFVEQFDRIKEKSFKNNEKFFVCMVDIDGLKKINDSYGHLAGDKVIVRIASELFRNSSNHDVVCRFGGDEFVGVFVDTDKDALEVRLDSIINSMRDEPVFYHASEIIPSFTYGISSFPEDGQELNELVKIADERMYTKKKHGNKVS